MDIEDEHGGHNRLIIPRSISFEVRLLIDVVLYINLFLLILAFVYPQMFSALEFVSQGITFRYPHPIFLANWGIFSFFVVVIPGELLKDFFRKKSKNKEKYINL